MLPDPATRYPTPPSRPEREMPAMEALRRKIDSVRDLHGVVRAMKSLAAARIRQCREAASAVTAYERTVELGLQAAMRGRTETALREEGGGEGVVLLALGSDQGLVGAFNTRTADAVLDHARETGDNLRATLVVGTRLAQTIAGAGLTVSEIIRAPASPDAISPAVRDLIPVLEDWRVRDAAPQLLLCYNEQQPDGRIAVQSVHLLPLKAARLVQLGRQRWPTRNLPTHPVPWAPLLASLVRESLFVSLFRAFAASLAAENASRLSAMQSAETRIDERLAELDLGYRQLRQVSITEELIEIIAGFESIVGRSRDRC